MSRLYSRERSWWEYRITWKLLLLAIAVVIGGVGWLVSEVREIVDPSYAAEQAWDEAHASLLDDIEHTNTIQDALADRAEEDRRVMQEGWWQDSLEDCAKEWEDIELKIDQLSPPERLFDYHFHLRRFAIHMGRTTWLSLEAVREDSLTKLDQAEYESSLVEDAAEGMLRELDKLGY